MRNVRVYTAAPFDDQDWLRVLRRALHATRPTQSFKVTVTSRWLDVNSDGGESAADAGASAENMSDIRLADAFVCLNPPRTSPARGGRHIEFGYALALGKPILLFGWSGSIHHKLPVVSRAVWDSSVARTAAVIFGWLGEIAEEEETTGKAVRETRHDTHARSFGAVAAGG